MSQKFKKPAPSVFEDYDYLGHSASVTDCTGLIPSKPLSKAERDSYEAIYHYLPKASLASSPETLTDPDN